MRWSLLLLTACSAPAPAPVAVTAPARPAGPTCAEAGVILRGDVDTAGPEREQAIQSACEQDHWSPSMLRCVAGTTHPSDCLGKLTADQHASYDAKLKAWSAKYEPVVAEPAPDVMSCEDALHNSDFMAPVLDDRSPERAWQSELRHRELVGSCDRKNWSADARACLAIATTPDAIDGCLTSELDPAVLDNLHRRFDDVAATAKAIAALRGTPAKLECKRVVDAHYADKKWQGKGTPTERKESRTAMLAACKAEAWDEFRRACIIVDSPSCPREIRWQYPALSTSCEAYALAIDQLARCKSIPPTTFDALKQAFDATRVTATPDSVCQAAADAVIAVLRSASC